MGERLKSLVDLYSKKAAEFVERSEARFEKFKEARELATKLTTPVNDTYKTLGELAAAMFPENGGINDDLFKNIYINLSLEKEDKDVINSVFKFKGAPIAYENALEIQNKGGEKYFNEVLTELGKVIANANSLGSSIDFDKIVGKNSKKPEDEKIEEFSDFVESTISVSGPGGIISSPEFYYAVLENGTPLNKKESVNAQNTPINEGEETSGLPIAEKSAVNPEKGLLPEKTEVISTAGQVTTTPPEVPIELKEENPATPININVENLVPSSASPNPSTGTTLNQSTQTANVTNQTALASNTINEVSNNPSSISQESSINSSNNEFNTALEEQNFEESASSVQTNEIANSFLSQINDSIKNQNSFFSGANLTGSLGKMLTQSDKSIEESIKFINSKKEEILNTIFGGSPINAALGRETAQLKKENIESIESSINEASEITNELNTNSILNEESTKNSMFSSLNKNEALTQAANLFGINEISSLGNEALFQSNKQKGGPEKVSSEAIQVPQQVEISKTTPVLPQETRTLSTAQAQSPIQNTAVDAVEVSSPKVTEAAMTESREMSTVPQSTQVAIDLTSLENRLMRIEHILSSTLEVKIIE